MTDMALSRRDKLIDRWLLAPRWGILLVGLGFLAHGVWDAYYFRQNKVVHRRYAEFCGVVAAVVGPALMVAALVRP
jgi:hypothetical protein